MKNLKCPKCDKIGANKSLCYPTILVHKCDGVRLEEVAKICEPDGTKKYNEYYYDIESQTHVSYRENFRYNSYDFLD